MNSPRPCHSGILAVVFVAAVGFTMAATHIHSAQPRRLPTVQQLNVRGVNGLLGHPLGTIVTVEGRYLDGDSTRLRELSGVFLLVIEKVNGQRLKSPARLRFNSAPGGAQLTAQGDAPFHIVGYESGGFRGLPHNAFDYMPAVATTEFHFESNFTVLAEKKDK